MQFSFAQEKTVTGTVTEEGLPLPGVSVVIKGTTQGTQTDMDGNYTIKAKTGESLVFSFIGMAEQTIVVGASNKINVVMKASATEIEGLVITALGIKRKSDEITTSYAVVKSKEITQAAAPNVTQALVGKVSGLQITQGANTVGGSSQRIVINGSRSISGNNQALVVIDNVIQSAGILNSLPPEIIDNVNVIKGAQGAALYGEQGVNGVIIVTTKKGATLGDKVTVTLNSSVDFQSISYVPQRQTRYGQGWNGEWISYENGGWGPEFNGAMLPVGLPQADGSYIYAPYTGDYKNIKDFFQTGTLMQNSVSVSGGNSETGFVNMTIGRQDREFVVENDLYKRTNFTFRGGKKLGEKWYVEGNAQYFGASTNQTSASFYDDLLQTSTNVNVRDFKNSGHDHHWTGYFHNPYTLRDNLRYNTSQDFFSGISTLGYNFNKNISATWTANVRTIGTFQKNWNNGYVNELGLSNTADITSFFFQQNESSRNIYSDVLLNFDYMLTDNISFKANLGNNIQDNYYRVTSAGGTNINIPGLYSYTNVLNPYLASEIDNYTTQSRKYSFFANTDFGYKNFVNLNLTLRNDNTSVLNKENNSYWYPGVGVNFIPTNAFESLKGDILNYFKVYGSWTKVGNTTAVEPYAINPLVAPSTGFPFGDLAGYSMVTNPTDSNIKPEFVTTKDFGINLGFFNDRLTLDAQYYITDTEDLITRAATSYTSGVTNALLNVGALQTKGFNIDLSATPLKLKDFQWDLKANLSHNKTIVKKVTDDTDRVRLLGSSLVGIYAQEGEEFPLIRGVGYQRDDQGRVIIDPTSGNPLLDADTKLGSANPDYILGLTTSFNYKGLKLTAVMDYRTGHKFYSETKYQLAWSGYLEDSAVNGRNGGFIFPNSSYESAPGVYTENTNIVTGGNTYASYQNYFSEQYARTAENQVLDATAFKVRELSLSYTLPNKLIEKTGLSNVTFGVNARNPFMWLPSENKYYSDPESQYSTTTNAQGYSVVGNVPTTRTVGFALNVTF